MGRPLNKKYFGNRNIGTGGNQVGGPNSNSQNYADDRIGGEGFAGVTFGASVADTSYGSGAYLNKIPHITAIGTPSIPGGVQADADVVTVKAVHAVVNQSGTPNGADYLTGDILTVTTGSPITPAKFTVGALQVSGFTIVAGNDGNTAHGYAVGDTLNFTNGVILTVATINGAGYPSNRGVVTTCTLTNTGSYTGTTPPTGTVGHTNTLGGQGFTCNFSWGVKSVTVLQAGVYPIVAGSANTTTLTHGDLTESTATGCTLDIFYGIDLITVNEKGSGYRGTETVTFTDADVGQSETRATGTMVLTTDTGAVGSATNQENAIIIRANTSNSGTTAKVGDIIKQSNTRSYKVRTADGIAVCKLATSVSPGPGRAYIVATAVNGSTYYVIKLTAHRATLVYKSGTSLPALAGKSAKWSFAPASGTTVQIENA
jgi:hypothetical protein